MKEINLQDKDEKVYMHKMNQKRKDRVGANTNVLDKQWADRPMGVIKNAHKLSEVELY